MTLFLALLIGALMILTTIVIHAIAYDWILKILARSASLSAKYFNKMWKIPLLIFIVSFILGAIFIDIWLWTFLLLILDESHLHTIEAALYFTTTSFTTVGYGDIVLDEKWRILGTICAINGMFLFGWSAAFIYEIMAKLYDDNQILKKKW